MERPEADVTTKGRKTLLLGVLSFTLLLLLAGCASTPGSYDFTKSYERFDCERRPGPDFGGSPLQAERGRPVWLVDKLGHYFFSLPGKLILWNTRIGNHKISPENMKGLLTYLEGNDLDRVKVRINQYAPLAEFGRLWKNSDVNPFYRATFGFGTWLTYTLLPGRLLAGIPGLGDSYNPYTNTINLYSDHPAVVVQRASRAKDLVQRHFKGTYAALGIIPGVDLYQEHLATRDAIRYFYWRRDKEKEKSGYFVLFPEYGTHLGQGAVAVGPLPAIIYAAVAMPSVVIGHAVGRIQSSKRMKHEDPPLWQELAHGSTDRQP